MDETEELIRLCGRALVAQMSDVLGFELHMARNCVLGLTGEPLADFNGLTSAPTLTPRASSPDRWRGRASGACRLWR